MSSKRGSSWIECVANELGIDNMDRSVNEELERSIKNEIASIIQDSIKFSSHAFRKKLLPSDIHCTLNMRNSPPIIGSNAAPKFFDPNDPNKHYRHRHNNDNNNNLEEKQSLNLSIPKSKNNIMIKDDPLLSLNDVKNECISKPAPISVIVSWLAINGQVIGSQASNNKKNESLLSRIPKKNGSSSSNRIEIIATQCHDISKEQQLFFQVLRNTAIKCDINSLNTFINILQNSDAGLIRLVPRIVSFIASSVKENVNDLQQINLNFLYCLMRIAEALILSRYLSDCLESYLQQFVPPILTCCMKENLSLSPTENHWNLRNKSAKIIYFILNKYGNKFPMVRSKVVISCIKYFNDLTLTFKTHYGAIICMKELGIDALETGLLPHLKKYINIKLKPVIDNGLNEQIQNQSKSNKSKRNIMDIDNDGMIKDDVINIKQNVIKQYEAKMVLGAILESLWMCHQHQINNRHNDNDWNSDKNKQTLKLYHELQEMFGESLIPFNSMPPDCQNYFI